MLGLGSFSLTRPHQQNFLQYYRVTVYYILNIDEGDDVFNHFMRNSFRLLDRI